MNRSLTNFFTIEEKHSNNLYETLINSITLCTEFNTKYKITEVKKHIYTIQKSVRVDNRIQYSISVYNSKDSLYTTPIATSTFLLSDLILKDNILHITDNSYPSSSIKEYIIDKKLYTSKFSFYSLSIF